MYYAFIYHTKMYRYCVIVFMFKVEKVMVPDIVSTLFDKSSNVHNYYTRRSQQLFVPRVRTNALAGTIRVRGVNIWNTITTKILPECNLTTFRYLVKDFLLNYDDE